MNQNIEKIEKWFEYYQYVYNIFLKNVLVNKNGNLSIQLSFFNSVPQEEYDYEKGQIIKLELLKNREVIEGISLKTIDSEENLFQYIWLLTVLHFINNNYKKEGKIKINTPNNSTRGFNYLLSDIKQNGESIARANFTMTYNKKEYDDVLHQVILNHNNNHDNVILLNNVREFIMNNSPVGSSVELNNSIKKSKGVYEKLHHNNIFR